ncbi:alpha/beta fold hydrolase [Labrenzia sp. PHM005]|uniref:alpha/beta fold hydrolase n=1 Tax=Labrenzia sp. PHM005 TaxID=2590016 RepID=UPI0011404E28|nr:alpha/beta hydrolase [Labrenzia sp. PHM005]QDG77578.1 alpha/beta hydrolase [Labrenzia sp. PHM005]
MSPINKEADLAAFEAKVSHHYTDNNGTKIHYASIGDGPLVVFIHGFPDHWLTWWEQMNALSANYRTVAMDLRGYNLSDQPEDEASYTPNRLAADVCAVIEDCGEKDAIVIGHDWGGFVAWQTALLRPEKVSRLGIVNLPHPWAISRELANNPDQQKASGYARVFQQPGSESKLDFDRLSTWIHDPAFRSRHIAAMEASNRTGMLNYYRVCFPAEPYQERKDTPPKITVPVLIIHGMEDPYVLTAGHNGVWEWVAGSLTIRTWPGVGHFVQQDAPDRLTAALSSWLGETI